MADAVVDLQASNIFGLAEAFNTQSSTTSEGSQNVATNDESGNVACQQNITVQTDYTQSASYCGIDFGGGLGTFLSEFGNVQTVGVVTQLVINMTAGDYGTVDITGHQHVVNPHIAGYPIGHANFEGAISWITDWDGFGVPHYGIEPGATSSLSSATVTLSMTHVDTEDEGGDHFTGKNITPRAELTQDFEGTPTANTVALIEADLLAVSGVAWIVDSIDTNDSNSEFDTFSYSAHANVDLTVDPA